MENPLNVLWEFRDFGGILQRSPTIIILSPFFRQNKTGNPYRIRISRWSIVALWNEKGSYNYIPPIE